VSSAEHFVRHHRLQTDRAISRAYARLATNALAAATFHELLHCVRARARRILDAPVVNGHHPGVEALVNLSRFAGAHIRKIREWPGTSESASWRPAIGALAEYLLCEHPVPRFLAAAWYGSAAAAGTDDELAERKRQWFIAHGRGASFRSLDLPIAMTRKMEHLFLMSHDHLGIEMAMRRAELIGLGVPDDVVRAVLATPVANDLRNGEFWRTFWMFLIANASAIDTAQIAPLIDYIQAVRHERFTIETADGFVMRDPPQPAFSMKGRTLPSMMRLMDEWHRGLGREQGGLTWKASPLRPMLLEEPCEDPSAPPLVWQMIELTTGEQLRMEGAALRHCVGRYADKCWRGMSQIWSLRVRRGDKVRHALTIEVDLARRAVIQARGWGNRLASGKPLRLLQDWTMRERLRLLSR
jgi:PcfJ-like protein